MSESPGPSLVILTAGLVAGLGTPLLFAIGIIF